MHKAAKIEDYSEIRKTNYGFSEVPEVSRVIAYLKENNIFQENFLNTFLDIGSNRGKVAQAFYKHFIIYPDKIHLIEPDIISFENIKALIANNQLQKFNAKNLAFSNKDEMKVFRSLSHISFNNRGDYSQLSTLHDRDYPRTGEILPDGSVVKPNLYEVEVMRGETYMKKFNLKNIDFCKIDAEGHAYQILEGFGELISNIKCIFLETENFDHWQNQKYASDVSKLLTEKSFYLELDIVRSYPWFTFRNADGSVPAQFNQLWINRNYQRI